MNKALVAAIAFSTVVAASLPTHAADLIQGYRAQTTTYQQVRKPKRVYVQRTVRKCDQLLVEYRRPYTPRTEIVHLCHTPVYVQTRTHLY